VLLVFHVQNIPRFHSERIADKRWYQALIQLRAVNISCCARKIAFSTRASFSEIIARAATTCIVNGQSQTIGASCRCLTFTSMLTHRLSLIGKADKYGRAKDIQSPSDRYACFIYGVNFSARCGTRWTFWNVNGLARRKLYFTSASGHVHKLSRWVYLQPVMWTRRINLYPFFLYSSCFSSRFVLSSEHVAREMNSFFLSETDNLQRVYVSYGKNSVCCTRLHLNRSYQKSYVNKKI